MPFHNSYRIAIYYTVYTANPEDPVELCELFAQKTGNWVGRTAMCSALQKLGLNRKKKQSGVAKQAQKKS